MPSLVLTAGPANFIGAAPSPVLPLDSGELTTAKPSTGSLLADVPLLDAPRLVDQTLEYPLHGLAVERWLDPRGQSIEHLSFAVGVVYRGAEGSLQVTNSQHNANARGHELQDLRIDVVDLSTQRFEVGVLDHPCMLRQPLTKVMRFPLAFLTSWDTGQCSVCQSPLCSTLGISSGVEGIDERER